MTKVNTHPTHPPMFPITPADNAWPFETITMDFITKLPQSGGFNTILMIMDTNCSEVSIFIPCHKTINLEGVALLYLNDVIPDYGIPHKIILDHDVCFILKFSTELCQILNIHQNISTAYHPQTDGASERTNQTLEQYLQVSCGTQQDNWHAWLPLAQYTKNSWPSATTKKTPYDLLIGYTPQVHQPTRKTTIPSLEEQLSSIEETRKATQEAQRKAQESWIKECPWFIPFPTGSKVWLEGTNLKLPSNITPKLSPRRYGPFKVVSQISKVAYKLELPSTWKIHNVFHASLLMPYKETDQHGPNFLEPPPEILDGEPEWEIQKILKEGSFGHWKKKQYLVCWKDYLPAHDSWVNAKDLHAPELLLDFQNALSSIRTLPLDKSSPACPTRHSTPSLSTPLSIHSATSSETLPSGLATSSMSSSQLPRKLCRCTEWSIPLTLMPLNTPIFVRSTTVPITTECPSTSLSQPTSAMSTLDQEVPQSIHSSPSMVMETLPFSPWSSQLPDLPTIAGLEVAATVTDIYSNLRTALSSFPGTLQGQPLSFPTPILGCTSPSPIPIPPHISHQSKDNMAWVPSPSPLLTLPPALLLQCQSHRPLSPQPSSIHSNIVVNTLPDSELLILAGQIPSSAMVHHVRKQCRALLKYMEAQGHITGALLAWTDSV